MKINDYFTVPYVDGGRDVAVGLDCWGLVRHVAHNLYQLPLFEGFGCVTRKNGEAMHAGYHKTKTGFQICKPKAGALACCFIKEKDNLIFHHVGICTSALDVLHTGSAHGVKKVPVRAFKRLACVVQFYEYVGC